MDIDRCRIYSVGFIYLTPKPVMFVISIYLVLFFLPISVISISTSCLAISARPHFYHSSLFLYPLLLPVHLLHLAVSYSI